MQEQILFCILHGLVYSHRHDHIKSTWGIDKECLFYADYEDRDKNVIKVSDRSDYSSNEEKHVNAIRYVSQKFNHDWFFFCDDDTFVNTTLLQNSLGQMHAEHINGSLITGCWPEDTTLPYCSGGAGYLLHRSLLLRIASHIDVRGTGYSDVTLGLCLRDLNIKSVDDKYFNSQPPKFYDIELEDAKNYITFHYIKTKAEMTALDKICRER